MDYLSTFEQKEIEITKEQAQKVDDYISAFNKAMIADNIPVRLKLDDAHNTKRFFVYTDWINTEPSIVNGDGYRIFNGDICSARATGIGGLCLDTDEGPDAMQCDGIDIDADKQPIHIFVDDKGIIHAELDAYGGSTGNDPDDGPAWEGNHDFEPDEITLIERK